VGLKSVEAEQLTGHQKLVDLATAIFHKIHDANATPEDLVAAGHFVVLAVNLPVTLNRYGCSELFQ
jgi:hypothetical protein